MTEELRILAGLQETKSVKNPIDDIILKEQELHLHKINEESNINTKILINFDDIYNNFVSTEDLLTKLKKIFESPIKEEILNSLDKSIYPLITEFLKKAVHSMDEAIIFTLKHRNNIIREIENLVAIQFNESLSKSETYFSSTSLDIPLFNDYKLSEESNNSIEFGAQISILENVVVVNQNGKKYFTKIPKSIIKEYISKDIFI